MTPPAVRRMTWLAAGAAALAAGYSLLLRNWCVNWGATEEEIHRQMPGDELLDPAALVTNRSITIRTPASAIWPWLLQMGPGRGGAYTYDWIENLFGLDMHSVDTVHPELQNLEVGDTFAMGSGPRLRVHILQPEQALVLVSEDGQWVWAFGLYPCTEGTRLVSRNRIGGQRSLVARLLFRYLMEPGSLIMERKMLVGIQQRAQHHAAATALPPQST
jgi:hypothetical protein